MSAEVTFVSENSNSFIGMQNRSSGAMLALISWIGAAAQFLAAHYSMLLSVICGLGAFAASIYSIKASRAKAKFYDDKDALVRDDDNE